WHRNLEPVLASVAGAADPQASAFPLERTGLHEPKFANARNDRLEHLCCARTLKREQRLPTHVIDDNVLGHAPLHVVDVAIFGCAVDDDVEILAASSGHQVVYDPTVII